MVRRDPSGAIFQQVARTIRARILSGELAPGEFLQSEKSLAYELETSVWSIGAALEELRHQGYIAPSKPGRRAQVAEQVEPVRVELPPNHIISVRPATEDEAVSDQGKGARVVAGSLVLVVDVAGQVSVYPAIGTILVDAKPTTRNTPNGL